jgi:hypothetical protein
MLEECQSPPLLKPHETAIVDYGYTGNFLVKQLPLPQP